MEKIKQVINSITKSKKSEISKQEKIVIKEQENKKDRYSKKIGISAESTIDCPIELLAQYDIHTVAFKVLLGNETKYDGEIKPEEIFNYVFDSGVLPKTCAVNVSEFENHFSKLLNQYDEIIHISFSSKMSSAYSNALIASESFNGKVRIIDSKTLSAAIALLSFYASDLVKDGKDIDTIVKLVEERVPYISSGFIVSKMDYLYKGGRCNSVQLFMSNILRIRLQILIKDGIMCVNKKLMGQNQACVEKYINGTLNEYNQPDLEMVFVTYTTETDETIEMVKKLLKERGFKRIYIQHAGATCSCHGGEHCLGIHYLNQFKINN